ncbi:28733_t:CDS:2, partial [Dentiscutata erythropus]
AWAFVFFNLSSLFFIVCIALNIHIVFINEYKKRYDFEKYYFIIAFSFALLLSLLPMAANLYSNVAPEGGCWYHNSGQENDFILQWVTLFGWIYASILYCVIVVIMVIRKLKSAKKEVDDIIGSQIAGYPTLINKTVISFVVRRIVWYPVVPLIAQFFSSFIETYAYVNHTVPHLLLLFNYIGISLQGLMYALVFYQDIAVTRAFQAAKLHWWITHVNYYESHYPYRSYNKAITNEFNMLEKSKLFSAPNTSSQFASLNLLSRINSTSSVQFGKDNSNQVITNDNQNDQDIHIVLPEPVHLKNSSQYSSLDLLSHRLNLSISPDSLINSNIQTNQTNINNISNHYVSLNYTADTSNYTIGDDEGRIDVMLANGEPTDIDISKEIEMFKLMLKRL